jgi:hypothetical protein
LSLYRPGSAWARPDLLLRARSALASAALVALACLVLGFGAPAAWADEAALAQAETQQSFESASTVQPTDSPPPESTQPSDQPPPSDSTPPAGPPASEQPSDTAATTDPPADQGTAPEAAPGQTSEASAQRRSGDSVTFVTSDAAQSNANDVGPARPLTTSEVPDRVVAITPAGTDIRGVNGETGGIALLPTGSLECGFLCFGHSGGSLGAALPDELGRHSGVSNTTSQASEPPPIPIPGAPGPARGPFFSLFGGAGGGAMGFMLLSLVAVLASGLLRHPDLTTAFRLPTAMWRPSVYVPPLESPG